MNRLLMAASALGAISILACTAGATSDYDSVSLLGPPPPDVTSNPPNPDTTPASTQPPPAAAVQGSAFEAAITGTAFQGFGSPSTTNTATSGNGGDTDAGN